jgi:hypothetical protein
VVTVKVPELSEFGRVWREAVPLRSALQEGPLNESPEDWSDCIWMPSGHLRQTVDRFARISLSEFGENRDVVAFENRRKVRPRTKDAMQGLCVSRRSDPNNLGALLDEFDKPMPLELIRQAQGGKPIRLSLHLQSSPGRDLGEQVQGRRPKYLRHNKLLLSCYNHILMDDWCDRSVHYAPTLGVGLYPLPSESGHAGAGIWAHFARWVFA